MKRFLALLLPLVATAALADSRVLIETYDPGRVYNVYAQVGRASLIQFEDDEILTVVPTAALGMGDAKAWNLGVQGNNIVLKPAQKAPDTNLVVATNKRTYAFDLRSADKGDQPTYVLRFYYPDTVAAKAAAELKREQQIAAVKAIPIEINTDYVWRGTNVLLKPTAAWDDGRFTRLVYDNAGELPVFFKVLPDGTEALINQNIDPVIKNTVVLHEVIRTARARLGNEVIEIVNQAYTVPKFNTTGAGVAGAVRTDKGTAK